MLRNIPKLTELVRNIAGDQTQVHLTPECMLFYLHSTERSGMGGNCLVDWRVRRQRDKMKKKVRTRLWKMLNVPFGKWHQEKGKQDGSFLLGRMTCMAVVTY